MLQIAVRMVGLRQVETTIGWAGPLAWLGKQARPEQQARPVLPELVERLARWEQEAEYLLLFLAIRSRARRPYSRDY